MPCPCAVQRYNSDLDHRQPSVRTRSWDVSRGQDRARARQETVDTRHPNLSQHYTTLDTLDHTNLITKALPELVVRPSCIITAKSSYSTQTGHTHSSPASSPVTHNREHLQCLHTRSLWYSPSPSYTQLTNRPDTMTLSRHTVMVHNMAHSSHGTNDLPVSLS